MSWIEKINEEHLIGHGIEKPGINSRVILGSCNNPNHLKIIELIAGTNKCKKCGKSIYF